MNTPARDPFTVLDLAPRFDLEPKTLEARVRDLQRTLHPDRHVGGAPQARRMALAKAVEVNEAYRALRDEVTRAEALLSRLAPPTGRPGADATHEPQDPAFLMEVMELREALGEARVARDAVAIEKLAVQVEGQRAACRARLTEAFERARGGDATALDAVRAELGRLRYFRRFLDEVAAIEDDLST